MTDVGVHEAKTHLSRLLRQVEAGEEVVILRGGHPVARLVPVEGRRQRLGVEEGRLRVPDDFNAPLREEILSSFER